MAHKYAGHRAAREHLPAFQLAWTQADVFLLHLAWLLLLVHEGNDMDFSGYNMQMSTQSPDTRKVRSGQLRSSVRHNSITSTAFSKQTVCGRLVLNRTQRN